MTVSRQAVETDPRASDRAHRPPPDGMRWERPGPGSWMLDAEHSERRKSRYVREEFTTLYAEGFRQGFARYGALLDTIECAFVNGFTYIGLRPLGAPPDATGTPPRALFWLLTRLHPALRKRIKRAREVFESRLWREDLDEFLEEDWPATLAAYERIQSCDLGAHDDERLIEHLGEMRSIYRHRILQHFRCVSATMIPVGDFIAHATEWTGCTQKEALDLLSGYSPYSVEVLESLTPAVDAIRGAADAREILEGDDDAGVVLERLQAHPTAGEPVRRWLGRVGQRIVTGHDLTERRGVEMPRVLVETLRTSLTAPPREVARERIDRAARRLRERVPQAHRAAFDELLAEARRVHPLRDARSVLDFWAFGLLRRALLEVGRRLHERGRILDVEHVVDLTHDELVSVLRGGEGPSAAALAAEAELRATQKMSDVPETLGPPPGDPPPPEWLPPAAARVARATTTYMDLLSTGQRRPADHAETRSVVVAGLGASPGKHVGRARLVSRPDDFAKIDPGDVVVARLTTPAYNVVLPLIGAIVTDRGGLLSHPAIVSREYGLPGVVGCRDATARIPDGARVEVCGDTGTVTVLE